MPEVRLEIVSDAVASCCGLGTLRAEKLRVRRARMRQLAAIVLAVRSERC